MKTYSMPAIFAVLLISVSTAAHCQETFGTVGDNTPCVKRDTWGRKHGNNYGHAFEHFALPADKLPKVIKGHPRLLVRAEPWKGGLCADEVRARAKKEPWVSDFKKNRDYKKPDRGPVCALYYLATGDESVIPGLIEKVMSDKPRHKCGEGLVKTCMIYDWICHSPSITAEQKKKMRDHIAKVAFGCAAAQESGDKFDMWQHRGGGGWPADVLVAGLTLYGEHPDGEKLLSWGAGFYYSNLLRGWGRTGGVRQGGGNRYVTPDRVILPAIGCWESATEGGICETIRNTYGNWVEGRLFYLMHYILPDKTRVDTEGMERLVYARTIFPDSLLIAARACKRPETYAFMRWYGWDPKIAGYGILLYDEELDKKAADGVSGFLSGSSSRLWGPEGTGYVQMRSRGWQPDSTVVEFVCGDYFWSHALNTNQNSFYIWHKGRLAIHSGEYSSHPDRGWYGGHMARYSCRTVACNSMLVHQPGEFWWTPVRNKKGGDKQGCFSEYGGQRNPLWGGSNAFSYDEYLERLNSRRLFEKPSSSYPAGDVRYFEMGNITAFECASDNGYSYVCGDATMAYNNPKYSYSPPRHPDRVNKPKIDLFTRSMAWLDNTYLVVFDRVNSLNPSYRKAWLLHSIAQPKVSGRIIKAETAGHIEDFDGDTVQITWADGEIPIPDPVDPGRLFCRTFLPDKHYIRRIGGKGHEFWLEGENWPPHNMDREKYRKRGQSYIREMGAWRIEVSPAEPSNFDNFLHLIHICDAKTEKMAPASMIAADEEKMVGLHVGGWIVMFGKKSEVEGEVSYSAPEGKTKHLIVDLKRGIKYTVSNVDGGKKAIYRLSSKEGTLHFITESAARVRLTPTE